MAPEPAYWRGFEPGALDFFEELAAHNERSWFLANKDRYERSVKAPMMDLVADLSTALAAHDVPLFGDPKRALFRINRDVRFSRDKRPYKTVVSAVLSRDGEKRSPGLFYVQFGPNECLAAMGFYQPEPPLLAAMRARILARRGPWQTILRRLEAEGLPLSRSEAAARLPRGLNAAQAGDLAPDLKLRSFVVVRRLSDADATDPGLVERLAALARSGLPLLEFGWSALADLHPKAS